MSADVGQRLHGEQMGADDRVVAPLVDELAEPLSVGGVDQIDRRGDAELTDPLPGLIHEAEQVRHFR